jgi:hypothetical protein
MSAPISPSRRLWQIAGAFAIAHVVLMFGSFSLQLVAPFGSAADVVAKDHIDSSMAKVFTGGFLTALSFMLFLAVASLFATLVRGRTDGTRWASSLISMSAAVYVAIAFAAQLPPLAAAIYAGHHGASVEVVSVLVTFHWFGVYLATAVLGLFTLALSAGLVMVPGIRRWASYAGFVVGALCIVGLGAARAGLSDFAMLVWAIWFVVVGVLSLRPRELPNGEANAASVTAVNESDPGRSVHVS